MNRELLQKLYSEAVEKCVKISNTTDGASQAWLWEEKFAELIVNECVKLMRTKDYSYTADPIFEASCDIQERFGI